MLEHQDCIVRAIERLLARLEAASSPVWSESSAAGVALCVTACFGSREVLGRMAYRNEHVWDILESPHKRLGLVCTRVSPRSAKIVSEWLQELANLKGLPAFASRDPQLARHFPTAYSFSEGHTDKETMLRMLKTLIHLLGVTSRGDHYIDRVPKWFAKFFERLGFHVAPYIGDAEDERGLAECYFRAETWSVDDVHKSELLAAMEKENRWTRYGDRQTYQTGEELLAAKQAEHARIMGLPKVSDEYKNAYVLERPRAPKSGQRRQGTHESVIVTNFPLCCFEMIIRDRERDTEYAELSGPQMLVENAAFGQDSYADAARMRGVTSTGLLSGNEHWREQMNRQQRRAMQRRAQGQKAELHAVSSLSNTQQMQCLALVAEVWVAHQAHYVLARFCGCAEDDENATQPPATTDATAAIVCPRGCCCDRECPSSSLCPGQLKALLGSTLEHSAAISGCCEVAGTICEIVRRYRLADTRIIDDKGHRRRLEKGLERSLLDFVPPRSSKTDGHGSQATERQLLKEEVRAFCSEFVTMMRASFAVRPVNAAGFYPHDLVTSSTTMEDSCGGILSFVTTAGARQLSQMMHDVKKEYEEDKEAHIAAAAMSLGNIPVLWHVLALAIELLVFTLTWLSVSSLIDVAVSSLTDRFWHVLGYDAALNLVTGDDGTLWLACQYLPGILAALLLVQITVSVAADIFTPHVKDLRGGSRNNGAEDAQPSKEGFGQLCSRCCLLFSLHRQYCEALERASYDFVSRLKGWESSTAADLEAMRTRCDATLREWEGRRIKADIERHVNTKRITTDELRWLLADLEELAKTDEFATEIVIELPVSHQDAERFLRLPVTQPPKPAFRETPPTMWGVGEVGSSRARVSIVDIVGDACDVGLDPDYSSDDDDARSDEQDSGTADGSDVEDDDEETLRPLHQLLEESPLAWSSAPFRFDVGFPVKCRVQLGVFLTCPNRVLPTDRAASLDETEAALWYDGAVYEQYVSDSHDNCYRVLLDNDGQNGYAVPDDDEYIRDRRSASEPEPESRGDETAPDRARHADRVNPAQELRDYITEGGYRVDRGGKHVKLRRTIRGANGEDIAQTVTLSLTPSDHRARKNELARLRRNERERVELLMDYEDDSSESDPALAMESLEEMGR